jgi:hypothetical protein
LDYKGDGNFEGDICSPCYETITTGKVGTSFSFIGKLDNKAKNLDKILDELFDEIELEKW